MVDQPNTPPAGERGEHFTSEEQALVGRITTEADARAAHHLASADPEKDGPLIGPAHEAKYGLQRAVSSREAWAAAAPDAGEQATPGGPVENTAGPRAR